jgi:hypothetical protein
MDIGEGFVMLIMECRVVIQNGHDRRGSETLKVFLQTIWIFEEGGRE